jgi:hypothetical protein
MVARRRSQARLVTNARTSVPLSNPRGRTIAASPTPAERRAHGKRIKGLTDFIEYLGKKEIDLTLQGRGPTPLFHYTNLDGLKGIIENQDLWLTHARYSNDEREITFGLSIADDAVASLHAEGGPSAQRPYLTEVRALLESNQSVDVYICCFCEEDDRLSQWRAYGADGNGVTIEINPMKFAPYTGYRPTGVLSLWKVKYKRDQQLAVMRDAVKWTFDRYGGRMAAREAANVARRIIDFFVPTFKDEGFMEEHEWRLIFAPVPAAVKPRFRVARNMMVPYHSLKELVVASGGARKKGWRLPIRAVRIGPSRHKELNALSAETLLVSAGYEGVGVERSAIAYRGT